jgi:hypothetical protein
MSMPPAPMPAPLPYAPQRHYRARRPLNVSSVLRSIWIAALIGIIAAAIPVAAQWMIGDSRAQFIAIFAQIGFICIVLLERGFRSAGVQSRLHGSAMAVFCGVVGFTATMYALYVHSVYDLRDHVRNRAANLSAGDVEGQVYATYLKLWGSHPFELYDRLHSIPLGHRGGFPGFLIAAWKGKFGPVYAVYFGAMVVPAAMVGWKARHRLYCENCGNWLKLPRNISVAPARLGPQLSAAIEAQNCPEVVRLLQSVPDRLGVSCAVVQLHSCASCGQSFAETVLRGSRGNARLNASPIRVSDAMIEALKTEAPEKVEEVSAEDPADAGGRSESAEPPADINAQQE